MSVPPPSAPVVEARVFHWPKDLTKSPYLELFYGALEPHGVRTDAGFMLSPRWLLRHTAPGDVVHFHWAEWLWNPNREPPARALAKLAAFLLLAGRRGVLRAWTVHNLEPHEGGGWADRAGTRLLATLSDLVICHSEGVAEHVRRRYRPRGRVVVMPHGSYTGWFPPPRPRADVLGELGLDPEVPVLACVGYVRDYKGLDVAAAAAARLGADAQLLVAGEPHARFDIDGLRAEMDRLPRAALVERRLSEQEVADLVSASDVVLLPYRKITGSGALLTAWSLGRAAVASDLPYFREAVPASSDAGFLFKPGDPAALAEAVRRALAVPAERRGAAAAELTREYAWERVVGPVAETMTAWARRHAPAR